jgi:hypothetical protein
MPNAANQGENDMTDLTQAIANPAPQYPLVLSPQDDLSLLQLGAGAGPFTVNVKVGNDGTFGFYLPDTSTAFPDGVEWTPATTVTTSATITFEFQSSTITGFTSTTTGFSFSPVTGGTDGTVSTTAQTVTFTVNTTTGGGKDPQIVVTPQ